MRKPPPQRFARPCCRLQRAPTAKESKGCSGEVGSMTCPAFPPIQRLTPAPGEFVLPISTQGLWWLSLPSHSWRLLGTLSNKRGRNPVINLSHAEWDSLLFDQLGLPRPTPASSCSVVISRRGNTTTHLREQIAAPLLFWPDISVH